MKLVITVCATGSYCYAMRQLAGRVASNLSAAEWPHPGVAIISGDNSKEVKEAVEKSAETLASNSQSSKCAEILVPELVTEWPVEVEPRKRMFFR